jgi:hypothetical protein
MTIKEIELEYTVYNLVQLARKVWGDNADEYLAGRLESVITYNQMKALIDSLKEEVMTTDEIICTWCLDNSKSCKACDDSYEGE